MTIEDERTEAEKSTHLYLVVGTDTFLSGWGGAAGGASVAAWATTDWDRWHTVRDWVESRDDMRNVRMAIERRDRRYRPRRAAHYHCYVVNPGHPALA